MVFDLQWETASIGPNFSGLPFVVWISEKGHAQHDCRVKIVKSKWGPEDFTVTVPHCTVVGTPFCSARDLDKIFEFVKLNENALLQLWNDQIEYAEFYQVMQKVAS